MSDAVPCCVVDGVRAESAPLTLLDGAWYCPTHAKCAACGQPFSENVLHPQLMTCVCEEYGVANGHEELAWCSFACMESAHAEPAEHDPNTHEVDWRERQAEEERP